MYATLVMYAPEPGEVTGALRCMGVVHMAGVIEQILRIIVLALAAVYLAKLIGWL